MTLDMYPLDAHPDKSDARPANKATWRSLIISGRFMQVCLLFRGFVIAECFCSQGLCGRNTERELSIPMRWDLRNHAVAITKKESVVDRALKQSDSAQ